MKKLLVKNIGLLATPEGRSAHRGEEQGKIKFLKDAWVLIEDGIIASVGTGAVPAVEGAEVVDAEGHLVTPGLVDAHTHLIFGGWRQNELGLKLHGASYLDIQNAGGGIQSTTNATRQASEQELAAKASKALDEMMGFGTTTVEAKSGYGLATEHELKALEVIKDLNDHHRMDLVATFMGAHLVPAEYKSNREEYVRLVCEEMMPKVKEQGIAKFCDVFCEADTFTVEESRRVLEAGLK
ncbi:MAG: amidohydrolase family protein [Oscillospiraceae bacterium]|nr:amidohydrolase family protein [Oscillospiraceae bacterium]